ncbi:MAG: sulfurtransferase [Ilumatobacteraceae bacterium]
MPLISAAELLGILDSPDDVERPVPCDVRFHLTDHDRGRREYDSGHLPGAAFVDLHRELAGSTGGGRHPLPTVAAFVEVLGRLGIGPRHHVVAYDDAGGATASRLWWMLRSIGHERVSVLDGGLSAWTEAGGSLSTLVPERPSTVYPAPDAWAGTVDADGVARAIRNGTTVIDARAPARFRGDDEPIDPKAGHVPGAINRFHLANLDGTGRFRAPEDLVASFADVGREPIVYCGSGVTACHGILAMHLAGVRDARLYPGSWSEWSSAPDRPVDVGD